MCRVSVRYRDVKWFLNIWLSNQMFVLVFICLAFNSRIAHYNIQQVTQMVNNTLHCRHYLLCNCVYSSLPIRPNACLSSLWTAGEKGDFGSSRCQLVTSCAPVADLVCINDQTKGMQWCRLQLTQYLISASGDTCRCAAICLRCSYIMWVRY